MRAPLPIDAYIPDILGRLQENSSLILKAPPGTGKTTRVPPALAEASSGQLWVVVPRRLAAKSAAQRIAQERGWTLGEEVGYHFRFERRASGRTRILFLTEGMFFKLLQSQGDLAGVSTLILDEFHERHLHADFALNYARSLQKGRRPDLKILLMSATLEGNKLLDFLPRCASLEIKEATHPLEIEYSFDATAKLEHAIARGVQKSLERPGDLLVFLPGQAEIRLCEREISKLPFARELQIQALYGDLPWEEQQKIFEPASRRKLVLATNIAESSITLPGIRIVIDSGLHKEASFSPWSGIPKLATRPISQASAIQRAGRAAREAKGYCLRLYGEHDFKTRPSHEKPEIERAELSQSLLELFSLPELGPWEWFEPPPAAQLEHALELLFQLGATRTKSFPAPLTPLGEKMARLPLHPRLSRLLLEAEGQPEQASLALLCASLSEGGQSQADIRAIFRERQRPFAVEHALEQILRIVQAPKVREFREPEGLAHYLLTGFPDAVGKRRAFDPREDLEIVMCQGASLDSKPHPFLQDSEYLLVLDAQTLAGKRGTRNVLRLALPLSEEDLLEQADWIREEKQLSWNPAKKAIVEKDRLYYGKLVLEEKETSPTQLEEASRLFLKEALGIDEKFWEKKIDWHDFLRKWEGIEEKEILEQNLSRLLLWKPGLDLRDLCLKSLRGVFRLKQLEESPFSERILQSIPPEEQGKFQASLPTQANLAKGRKAKIHYRLDQGPWVASRLQDFLGVKSLPRLLGGKLPLTLHLLAPNQRPVQVTQDLESFWKNTYPQLRPQLSRRYPRHAWPEDPLAA